MATGGYFHRNRIRGYCPPCLLDVLADDGEDVGTEADVDAVLERLTTFRLVGGRRGAIAATCAPAYRDTMLTECSRCAGSLV